MSEPDQEPEIAIAVAVVVTSVAMAEVLAGGLRLAGGGVPDGTVVVPTPSGAVVAAPAGSDDAVALAGAVSRVLRHLPVVLVTGEGGRLSATRWTAGSAGEQVPPGVLMSTLDHVVERLLLGSLAAHDVPGAIEVARLSRWRAARMVAAARRSR